MANPPKRKGTRVENIIRDLNKGLGLKSKRVPGSGMFGGQYHGDVWIWLPGEIPHGGGDDYPDTRLVAEVKARKTDAGFKCVQKWLREDDLLFIKVDRKDPLVVMPWKTYELLMNRIVK